MCVLEADVRSLRGQRDIKQQRQDVKCTHQFEILNATNEVGSVGPPTFNVHTICVREKRKEKVSLKDVHTSESFHVFYAAGLSNMLFCVLLPLLKRHFLSSSQIQLECE